MNIITLTTDFGFDSPYVAEMKGAILSIDSEIHIVDATHSVAPQDIQQGAFAMRQFFRSFPSGTVHIAVVDPGVGTDRAILLVVSHDQMFIAPDNGLLSFSLVGAEEVRRVDRPQFWKSNVSPTFHGRDIMGPVAAHLCSGVGYEELSSPFRGDPIRIAVPELIVSSKRIEGEVMWVDSFGNLVTNIARDDISRLVGDLRVEVFGQSICFVETYAASQPGETIALIGSSGWLEIAVRNGSAREKLGGAVGTAVHVSTKC